MEVLPCPVQIRLIAWKKRRLTIELLNFPKLSRVHTTFGQRALDGDAKSVLILLQEGHDSSRVIEPVIQFLPDVLDLFTNSIPSSCEITLVRNLAIRGHRGRFLVIRTWKFEGIHGHRNTMDIVTNGFGTSLYFRPTLSVPTCLMKAFNTGFRECGECVLGVPGSCVRLLRFRKVVIEVGEALRHVVELLVQFLQFLVSFFDVSSFRRNQPGKNVLHGRRLDGEALQLVLGEELRWPTLVRRRRRVTTWTVDLDDRRSGAENVASSGFHLFTERLVVRQGSSDVDSKAVQKGALSRHAAPNNAGHVGTEADMRTGVPLRAEERSRPVNVHCLEPGTCVQHDVRGVTDWLNLSIAVALESDAYS